jgi:hypothetical protein
MYYLSSCPIVIGSSERLAQTIWGRASSQFPRIFNCGMASVQDRVTAFAPFIPDMPLDQMEFFIAPPVRAMPQKLCGEFGGIRDTFSIDH